MRLSYYGHQGAQTGPGRAARDWIKALRSAGVEVRERGLGDASLVIYDDDLVLFHGTPVQLAEVAKSFAVERPKLAVALTTWETQNLPQHLGDALVSFNNIVTPSIFSRDVIAEFRGAYVVPHCFDPNDWDPSPRPAGGPFTFYTVGSWGERKNVLGVLRAYLHAFDRGDDVKLVIISQGADFNVIRSVIARSGIKPDDLPRLLIPDTELTPEQVVQLHRDGDCFVSATRGEAWGLGMFEALSMQRPVVAPAGGGQVDFLSDFYADGSPEGQWYAVPAALTPVFAGEGEVTVSGGAVSGKLRLPRGADAKQLWYEPDLSIMASQMQAVYDKHRGTVRDYGCYAANREVLEDRYSTTVVGQKFVQVLKEISGS